MLPMAPLRKHWQIAEFLIESTISSEICAPRTLDFLANDHDSGKSKLGILKDRGT